jgi:hypothetical protein
VPLGQFKTSFVVMWCAVSSRRRLLDCVVYVFTFCSRLDVLRLFRYPWVMKSGLVVVWKKKEKNKGDAGACGAGGGGAPGTIGERRRENEIERWASPTCGMGTT